MTPDQVKLVQQSFAKVAPISEQAAVLFYDRLFEIAPKVKSMFPTDMTEQRKKLMATLAVVVGGLGNLNPCCRPRARWQSVTSATAPRPSTIPWSARALLWTLEKGLGRRLDARGRGGLDRGLRHAVRLHDFRSLRPAPGRRIEQRTAP